MSGEARLLQDGPDRPGAYLHVPFCARLCPYCPYDKVRYERGRVGRYFGALAREVDGWIEALDGPFTSLYVGGGTPSLCLGELARIVERIPVAGERAIELPPAHVVPPTVERLRQMGFDFVSVGVQSFDQGVLDHLGRRGDGELHRRAVNLALEHFDCVDVDLIFDVAYGSPGTLLDDLRTCFALGADQVSTYPLMRFGYTPFGKVRHQARREHELLRRAEAVASEHGYERRSVWTFNRRGTPSYTSITRELYVGMGAGAASYLGRWFLVNPFSPERYAAAVEAGEPAHARSWRLPGWVAASYWAFWQAYAGSVDLDRMERFFGRSTLPRLALAALRALGAVEAEGRRLVVTPWGRDVYHDLERWVTYHYIEPLWEDMMREHAAEDRPPGLRDRPTPWGRLQRRFPLLPA